MLKSNFIFLIITCLFYFAFNFAAKVDEKLDLITLKQKIEGDFKKANKGEPFFVLRLEAKDARDTVYLKHLIDEEQIDFVQCDNTGFCTVVGDFSRSKSRNTNQDYYFPNFGIDYFTLSVDVNVKIKPYKKYIVRIANKDKGCEPTENSAERTDRWPKTAKRYCVQEIDLVEEAMNRIIKLKNLSEALPDFPAEIVKLISEY